MGEWHPSNTAYMIYTDQNGVMEGNRNEPTVPTIYEIPADEVAAFKRLHNVAGAKWIAVYSLTKWHDSVRLKEEKKKDVDPTEE